MLPLEANQQQQFGKNGTNNKEYFTKILNGLLDANDTHRKEAERLYNECLQTNPNEVTQLLTQLIVGEKKSITDNNNYNNNNNNDDDPSLHLIGLRTLATVLLRKICNIKETNTIWNQLDQNIQKDTRRFILDALPHERNPGIAKKICHIVAQCESNWVELIPMVISLFQNNMNNVSSQRMLFMLLGCISEVSVESIVVHWNGLLPFFMNALSNDNNQQQQIPLEVKYSALKTALILISYLNTDEERSRQSFSCLTNGMISSLLLLIQSKLEIEIKELLDLLLELIDTDAMFFRNQIPLLTNAMLTIGGSSTTGSTNINNNNENEFDNDIRSLATEVLLLLCEKAPAVMRKIPHFPSQFFHLAISLSCDIPHDDGGEWCQNLEDDIIDDDGLDEEDMDQENAITGDIAMGRLSVALGGKTIMPIAVPLISQLLLTTQENTDWRKRRAALSAMKSIAEGCGKVFKEHLKDALSMIVNAMKDSHQRVRFEALSCLMKICETFPMEKFSKEINGEIITNLGTIIADNNVLSSSLRLRRHTVCTLIEFFSSAEDMITCTGHFEEDDIEDIFVAYFDALLTALCSCLGANIPSCVQSLALEAVASIANVGSDFFTVNHYNAFMPGIKGILNNYQEENDRLRDHALKCVGLLGEAVGQEFFMNDAIEVMQIIMKDLTSVKDVSDISFKAIGPATCAICKAIGSNFLQFIPVLIPIMMKTLELDTDFHMEDYNSDDEEDDVENGELMEDGSKVQSMVMNVKGLGRKKVSMNTDAIFEKGFILDTLYDYAEILGSSFVNFINVLHETIVPYISYKYNHDIRTSAALTIAKVFDCSIKAVKKGSFNISYPQERVTFYINEILTVLKSEVNSEARMYFTQALAGILASCTESGGFNLEEDISLTPAIVHLPTEHVRGLVTEFITLAKQSLARRMELEDAFEMEERFDKEEDEEALDAELETEETLMRNIIDCIGYLLKVERHNFITIFDDLLVPFLRPLLDVEQPPVLRANALALFDDAIEFCGPMAHRYLPLVNDIYVNTIADFEADPFFRQIAIYGVHQIIKYVGMNQFNTVDIITKIAMMLTHPDREMEENKDVTENAVSTLGTILLLIVSQQGQQFSLPSNISMENLVQLYISHLPLIDDESEARLAHRQFLKLLMNYPTIFVGQEQNNFMYLPLVLKSLGEMLHQQNQKKKSNISVNDPQIMEANDPTGIIVDNKTMSNVFVFLKNLESKIPKSLLENAFNSLEEKCKNSLHQH